MNKQRVAIAAIIFVVLAALIPTGAVYAKSKSPDKLNKKDFVCTWDKKKVDFFKQSKKDDTYSTYYWKIWDIKNVKGVSDIKTRRNVKFGSSESYVKKQYGKTKKVKVTKKETYYKLIKYNHPNVDVSTWKSYLEYTYKKSGDNYKIRFYLDKKNKVTAVIYLKNLEKFYKYPNEEFGSGLSFVPPKGEKVTVKTVNGKKVHMLPRGTKIYFENYRQIYETFLIQQWDKRGQELAKEYPVIQEGYCDEEIIKMRYGINVSDPNKYLYFSISLNGNPDKYAPKICYFKFK